MMKLAALTRRILPALLGILLCASMNAQEELISENFETIPGSYTVTSAEFAVGNEDIFKRTDGSNISTNYVVTDVQGNTYHALAAADVVQSVQLKSVSKEIPFDTILLTGTLSPDPEDTENPTALCVTSGTATVELDDSGIGSLAVEDIDAGSTDNFGIASMDLSQYSFDCSEIGSQPVILTVTDTNGNTATCTTDVEVVDVSPPLLSINDTVNLFLDASGSLPLTREMFNDGSSDNCGISSYTINPPVLDCGDINMGRPVTRDVIISEYVEGSGSNQYIELYNGSGAPANLAKYQLLLFKDGSTWPTEVEPLGYLGILEPGQILVLKNPNATLYTGTSYSCPAVDFDGNDFIQLQKLNLEDLGDYFGIYMDSPNSGWTLNGVNSQNHTLRRKRSVYEGNIEFTTNDFLSEWDQFDMDDVSDLGSNIYQTEGTEINILVIDESGNSASTSVIVNLADTIAPVLTNIPDDVVVTASSDQEGYIHWTNTPIATDNCSATLHINSQNNHYYFIGDTTITVSAIDPSGNYAYATFTATVNPLPLQVNLSTDHDSTVCFNRPTTVYNGASGGTRPFTFIWDGVASDQYNSNVSTPGLHILQVIDAAGETATDSIMLYLNPEITYNLTLINPSCGNCTDGSAYFDSLEGGTPPYQYGWANSVYDLIGYNVDTVYGLGYSQYSLSIYDDVNCPVFEAFTFDAEDTIPPTAICGSTTLVLDANGNATLFPADLNNGSSDNSGEVSFTTSQTSFDCNNVGDNDVILIVTDGAGNTSNCMATVTVIDTLVPVVVVRDTLYVTIDGGSLSQFTPNETDIGTYDNCGLSNMTVSPEYVDCADVVTGPPLASDLIISEYVEGSGNNKYIEIYNGTGTSVDLSNYELRLYTNGSSTIGTSAGLGNCGTLANGETAVFRNSSANIYGDTSYVNTAISFNGNDAIALFNTSTSENADIFGVIGQDPGSAWEDNGLSTQNHTLTRKRSVSTGNTDPVNAGFLAEWQQSNEDVVASLGSHSFALHGTAITTTATDNFGNIATGVTIVVAFDEVAPIFTSGLAPVYGYADPATCSAVAYWPEPGVFDNCSISSLSGDHSSGETFPVGTTPVTYTAIDPSGNSSTLTFDVIVMPQPLFLDIYPNQELSCHDTPGPITVFPIGGCQPYSYIWDGVPSDNDTELVGAGPHEVLVIDANGNSALTNFYLENPPALELFTASTNSICALANGEVFVDILGGTPPYSIVWSGDASGNGNSLSNLGAGTYIVTVTDSKGCSTSESVTLDGGDTTPTAICKSVTRYLDANGNATVSASDIDDGSFDSCGDVSLSANQTVFSCSDTGENEVILTVTNVSGNTASCTSIVTVIDNEVPVITNLPTDIAVTADPATCSAIVNWNAPVATDNCDATLTADYTSGDTFGNGVTTVTYTATDPSGNSVSQSFTITVSPEELALDINPNQYIHCHGGTADLEAYGIGGCEPYTFVWDGVPGMETHTTTAGEHTITISDANGTEFSVSFYVYEPEPLVLSLNSTNPDCSSTADGQITAIIGGGTPPYSVIWTGDATGTGTSLTNLGNGTYTATVTDSEGCSTFQSIILTATDLISPDAVCANTTLYLDQNGEATLNPADIDGGSIDNCGSVSLVASQTAFGCSQTGENEVYLSVTDGNGNTSVCAATVTVVDTISPVVATQDIEVSLDLTGFALVTPGDIDNGTSDNCGIASIEITSGQLQYGCEDTGNTFAVTLTATDIYGNTSSSVAQVTLVAGAEDEDGDGISDSCDICFGDNSYGDADGDGICDAPQWCPGAYDILDPSLNCDYQFNTPLNGFNANSGGIYCIAGPYNGQMITVSNGSTVRLSGTGAIKVQVTSNSALEVEDGANVTFTSLYLGWSCKGMVVHSGAIANVNSFSTTEPVVNCGTMNATSFNLGYNGIFTNYGTLNVTSASSNNQISGNFTNRGDANFSGNLTLTYNGTIRNYCTLNIAKDFSVGRFVNNYAFIGVGGETNISYNGIVSLFDGAMHLTRTTRISGLYAGYGAPSLVRVMTTTIANWTAQIQGELYFCDANGIESAPNYNNLFQGNAIESCNLTVGITDCNPVGNTAIPSAMTAGSEFTDALFNLESSGEGLSAEDLALAVQNIEVKDAIRIFPNPTSGKALVEFTPKNTGDVTISIFNVRGKQLHTFTPIGQVAGQPFAANLDLTVYENGVYFIRITDDIRTVTKKLVVAQ